jgi:hypothetical protein
MARHPKEVAAIKIGHLEVRRLTPRLLWDLFMVGVAFVNLALILFDLSYLLARPFYLHHLPDATRWYDQVKGIGPHPLSRELITQVELVERLWSSNDPQLETQRLILIDLTLQLLEENPFAACGRSRDLAAVEVFIANQLGQDQAMLASPRSRRALTQAFWAGKQLDRRLARFRAKVVPMLELSYFRECTTSGRPYDLFWLLDLPFLLLFWIEFLVRWFVAIRRRSYKRWFFFPIFFWYDLLGLIPIVYFRPFRLLRVASIYMRLRRSQLSKVGDDIISRGVAYIANIITEEVSDMVSIRLLSEYQEELRNGTHLQVFDRTIGARREEINQVLASQIREVLTDQDNLAHFRELLRLNLEHAAEHSEALHSVPLLPSAVLKPVVRAVGQVLLETLLETVAGTIDSDQGQEATQALVASVVDQLLSGPGLAELDSVGKEIGIDIFEQMKETIAVKKWAQK